MTQSENQEIPREQWETFFAELTQRYRGQPMTMEVRPDGVEPRPVAQNQRLDAISAAGSPEIELLIEFGGGQPHSLGAPERVSVGEAQNGDGQIVQIEVAGEPLIWLYLTGAPATPVSVEDTAPLGDSAGAAGGSQAAAGSHPGTDSVADTSDNLVSFGSSDDMGGVAEIAGGSLGDRDLSGRRAAYDITNDVYVEGAPNTETAGDDPTAMPGSDTGAAAADGASMGLGSADAGQTGIRGTGTSDPREFGGAKVLDGGSGQGVLDSTRDPIEGGPIAPGNDSDDGYVSGDVGSSEDRDIEDLRMPRGKNKTRDDRELRHD